MEPGLAVACSTSRWRGSQPSSFPPRTTRRGRGRVERGDRASGTHTLLLHSASGDGSYESRTTSFGGGVVTASPAGRGRGPGRRPRPASSWTCPAEELQGRQAASQVLQSEAVLAGVGEDEPHRQAEVVVTDAASRSISGPPRPGTAVHLVHWAGCPPDRGPGWRGGASLHPGGRVPYRPGPIRARALREVDPSGRRPRGGGSPWRDRWNASWPRPGAPRPPPRRGPARPPRARRGPGASARPRR